MTSLSHVVPPSSRPPRSTCGLLTAKPGATRGFRQGEGRGLPRIGTLPWRACARVGGLPERHRARSLGSVRPCGRLLTRPQSNWRCIDSAPARTRLRFSLCPTGCGVNRACSDGRAWRSGSSVADSACLEVPIVHSARLEDSRHVFFQNSRVNTSKSPRTSTRRTWKFPSSTRRIWKLATSISSKHAEPTYGEVTACEAGTMPKRSYFARKNATAMAPGPTCAPMVAPTCNTGSSSPG